jgi:diamine N-acetyltransferase
LDKNLRSKSSRNKIAFRPRCIEGVEERFLSGMKFENSRIMPDKSGEMVRIGPADAAILPSLMEMYRVFSPKPASQGLPPEDHQTCYEWVRRLFEIGENVLAWRGNNPIGHAALIPDANGRSVEFVIFVHQTYRHLGIGTELTRFTLEKARGLSFDSVWLTVALTNFIAIKLYRKFGFVFCDTEPYERTMMVRI